MLCPIFGEGVQGVVGVAVGNFLVSDFGAQVVTERLQHCKIHTPVGSLDGTPIGCRSINKVENAVVGRIELRVEVVKI